jgi:Zn-dependent M28 family amino/carboxypeptidase
LAVRISGRWETQPKEKDSEGNLVITQPKDPMMKLFSYLRLKKIHRIISNISSPEVKLFSFAEYLALDKDMDISFATSVYDYLGVVPSAV